MKASVAARLAASVVVGITLGSVFLALPNLLGTSGPTRAPVAEMVPVPAPAKSTQAAIDMTIAWIVAMSLLLSFAAFFLSRRVLLRI